jgi:predicted phage terminase large subunit-like protein
MVFMPPRYGKSEFISRYSTAWILGKFPDTRIILASYEADFAATWGRKSRDLLEEHGPSLFGIRVSGKSSAANRWDIEGHEGGMVTAGVNGPITGKGADIGIIDDPVKNDQEAMSVTYQERTWEWYKATFRTRIQRDGAIILIMTRWHENDLAGKLLAAQEEDGEEWDVISLPAIAEAEDLLGRDPGQPLCPDLFTKEALESIEKAVGSFWWASLYQQRPSPAEGGILKRNWWKFWCYPGQEDKLQPVILKLPNSEGGGFINVRPVPLPKRFDQIAQSWDMAFKDTKASAYVAGQVWGKRRADKFLLDQLRDKMDFVVTVQAVEALTKKWPEAKAKWVEDKANGPAVISTLKRKISGLIAVNPEGSKESRAYAVSPEIESGNVFLPHPQIAPWVNGFIDECAAFPNGKYADQVDAMTQALNKLEGKRLAARALGSKPRGW